MFTRHRPEHLPNWTTCKCVKSKGKFSRWKIEESFILPFWRGAKCSKSVSDTVTSPLFRFFLVPDDSGPWLLIKKREGGENLSHHLFSILPELSTWSMLSLSVLCFLVSLGETLKCSARPQLPAFLFLCAVNPFICGLCKSKSTHGEIHHLKYCKWMNSHKITSECALNRSFRN